MIKGVEIRVHIPGAYHTLRFMRYLGVDYGHSKIGLALSDEAGTMGFPHAIVPNTPRFIDEICELIEKEHVGCVVFGESRNLAGKQNLIAAAAHAAGEEVARRTNLSVVYEPEMYTSAQARRAPEKEGKTRAPKRHTNVDDSAAALILTSYLSRTRHG